MKINNIFRTLQGGLLVAIGLLLTTVSSVQASYESTVLNDHPLAYYALDLTIDNSGTATDLSGNGNNSSYYVLSPTAGPTAYIPNAAYFGGSGAQSFVDLSSGANAGILNFGGLITMEAWVQSTNTTQGPADILGKGYDSSLSYNELVLRANGGVNYYGGTYNNTNGGASASGGQQTTNWTYLVSTYDGTNWNLYVNAQRVGQGADTVGAINFSDPWAIGTGSADGFSRFFQGTICQLAMYTNALTPAQVLNHYYEAELNASPATSVPIIVTQPQSQGGFINGSITFTVNAVSSLAMTNQWLVGGRAITGQTGTSLTLNNLQVTNAGNYSVVVGNANGSTNSAVAVLTVSSGNNLRWNDGGTSGVWDTTNTANWLNLANSLQTVFNTGDAVLFDDTPGNSTSINVNANVAPSLITVNSSTNNFTIGSGTVTGPGRLVKLGSSTLTIYDSGNMTGPVTIGGGEIIAGNNTFSSVASITISNNATLDLSGGNLSGNKPVTVGGTGNNGQGAIINGYNDNPQQTVNITLTGDTLFGFPNRWDVAAGSSVSGPHYLTLDPSADQVYPANQSAANPYFEWSANVGANVLGIMLTNGIGLATSNAAVAYMGFHQMQNAFQNPGTIFTVAPNCVVYFWDGGCNGSLDVRSGAQVNIFQSGTVFSGSNIILESDAQMIINASSNVFNGSNIILGNGAEWASYGGDTNASLINSAVTLNGVVHVLVGDHNVIYTNLISGTGGFVWDAYNHQMVFSAANTYSGPTVIGGGGPTLVLTGNGSISHSSLIFLGGSASTNLSLDASGRTDGTLTLASGQTLGGVGTINGSLIVAPGATLSPSGTNTTIGITTGANSTGALSASNNVTLNGNTLMKLDGSGVSDEVVSSTKIAYGGTLTLANVSGAPLAVGNSFQLFSAPSMTGTFSSISPATPGPGLAWGYDAIKQFWYLECDRRGFTAGGE